VVCIVAGGERQRSRARRVLLHETRSAWDVRSKRAVVFVVVGTVCALIAVFAVHKRLSGAESAPAQVDGATILLAKRDIQFGEVLRLKAEGDKDANVLFVNHWPKDMTPSGAISDKEAFAEKTSIAGVSFVKHEPILESQVVAEEEFVPEGMYRQKIVVDADHARRFKSGMKVDVLTLTGGKLEDFLRCVTIYHIGRLDWQGRPIKEENPKPEVWLLVKEEQERAFLQNKADEFRLTTSANVDCDGPVLARPLTAEQEQQEEARWLLDKSRSLMAVGEYERALALLREIVAGYSTADNVVKDARRELTTCSKAIAENLLSRAQAALENGDQDAADAALTRIELQEECAGDKQTMQRVADLRHSIQEAMRESDYTRQEGRVKQALAQGNVPAAEESLVELVHGDYGASAEVIRGYERQIQDLRSDFDLARKVLLAHVEQGKNAEARSKLKEIRDKFPGHPKLQELEELVPAAGTPEE